MAVAEHKITQLDMTQPETVQAEVTTQVTVRLAEPQAAALRQAAAARGQSLAEFAVAALARAADAAPLPNESPALPPAKSFASVLGIFKDEPLMDSLMERIQENRARQAEQEAADQEAKA